MITARYASHLMLVSIFCLSQGLGLQAFGEGAVRTSGVLEPKFVPLEEGQGSYVVKIYDDNTALTIKDISFSGRTSIGGIRSEKDDSIMQLKLSKVKEIRIIKPIFQSKRFSDQEFTLASITTNNGATVDNVLVPKNIVICGVEEATQIERAWLFSKLTKLVIESGVKPPKTSKVKKESTKELNQKALEQQVEFSKQAKKQSVQRGILDAVEGIFGAFYDLVIAIVQFFVRLIR